MDDEDLSDKIRVSTIVLLNWNLTIMRNFAVCRELETLDPKDAPEEKFRRRPDGKLEIYARLPSGRELTMEIPDDQWQWEC